jgi:hypothetical protein
MEGLFGGGCVELCPLTSAVGSDRQGGLRYCQALHSTGIWQPCEAFKFLSASMSGLFHVMDLGIILVISYLGIHACARAIIPVLNAKIIRNRVTSI